METTPTGLHEKRLFPRKRLHHVSGEVRDGLSATPHMIEMLDISEGGIAFLSSLPHSNGSIWIVRFPMGGERIRGTIRIISCIQHSLVDAYRVGAEFKQLDIQHIAMIRGYLET